MKIITNLFLIILISTTVSFAKDASEARKIADHLQEISVTIKAEDDYGRSEGSGVLITREIDGEKVTLRNPLSYLVNSSILQRYFLSITVGITTVWLVQVVQALYRPVQVCTV